MYITKYKKCVDNIILYSYAHCGASTYIVDENVFMEFKN